MDLNNLDLTNDQRTAVDAAIRQAKQEAIEEVDTRIEEAVADA